MSAGTEREGLCLLAKLILSFVLGKYGTKNSCSPAGAMLSRAGKRDILKQLLKEKY
jgi:hypothetical protein